MTKRRCAATITTDKRGRLGEPCKLWARPGSEFCNRHQGGDGAGTPRDPDALANRCIARSSRTGAPCKRPALRGMRVCRTHGGATRASQNKAQELLDRMVEPVLWELRDIALRPNTSDSDRLRAIQIVLDRSVPRERKVEVEMRPWEISMQHAWKEHGTNVDIVRDLPPEELEQLGDHSFSAEDDVTEAELVDDENDELPRIVPPDVPGNRATIKIGSANPPQRDGKPSW